MGKLFKFLSGDVNSTEYGGTWYREAAPGVFHVIELINMDEACRRDNEGQSKYVVELSLIDLAGLSDERIKSALDCWGEERKNFAAVDVWTKAEQLELVSCAHSYGSKAPMGSWDGNAWKPLMKEAREESRALSNDEEHLQEKLYDTPVNRIGSSAAEYMQGDLNAALMRGVLAGDKEAQIMAKIQSGGTLSTEEIQDAAMPGCAVKGTHLVIKGEEEESE